jgi:hypothetical protein
VNPNTRTSLSRFLRQRGGYVLALGGLAVSIQVACSDQPSNPSTYAPVAGTPATTAGNTSTTAGTGGAGTAGTFTTGGTAAGTFTTGGAGAGTAGGGTGGDTTAGMSGGGTAGSTSAGMAGTGGQVVLTAYCMDKTPSTLPYTVNEGFQLSGWNQGAVDQAIANDAIMNPPNTDCMNRVPNAVGTCSTWRYTAKLASGYAYVQWITKWDAGFTHAPVCIDPAAKAVSFAAKGGKGGEKVTFAAGGGMQDKEITLSNKWETYFVPLDGVDFNTFDTGVVEGFEWKIVPTADAPAIDFAIDNIQWVKDAPVDGAGGAGGAGM